MNRERGLGNRARDCLASAIRCTDIVLTGRNSERLEHTAHDLGALSSEAFDATDFERLDRFLVELPTNIGFPFTNTP
jgi:NADP-dependent 3-hydroxy acid dehydrogenase YdfG